MIIIFCITSYVLFVITLCLIDRILLIKKREKIADRVIHNQARENLKLQRDIMKLEQEIKWVKANYFND